LAKFVFENFKSSEYRVSLLYKYFPLTQTQKQFKIYSNWKFDIRLFRWSNYSSLEMLLIIQITRYTKT